MAGRSGTSSSGLSRTSTAASTPLSSFSEPVLSLRIHRKPPTSSPIGDLYYRAVIAPTNETWDMLTEYSDCEVVGKGSYGEVVRAKRRGGGGLVAIKKVEILEENRDCDWENGLRLLREIFFLKSLNHPNLSKLIGIFPNNPNRGSLVSLNLVTAYFKDGCLSKYNPRTLEEVLGIQLKILNGLAFLHANGIVHRDVKRENIFIHKTGKIPRVVVGDFGLSRSVKANMTAEVVTKAYRCPSLLLGEIHYGPEIDVFAAGIVFLEMLSGKASTTILPNRKMGLRNFIRFQIALTDYTQVRENSRIGVLAKRMHLDLEDLIEGVRVGTDFDDRIVHEWSRQAFDTVLDVHSPGTDVVELAKSMIAFDPETRATMEGVINSPVFDCVRKFVEKSQPAPPRDSVIEHFDEEISTLSSDREKASAVKTAIWDLLQEDPVVGLRVKGSTVGEVFIHDTHHSPEPVCKRTRLQLRRAT